MPSALGSRKRSVSGLVITPERGALNAPRRPRPLLITGAATALLLGTVLCLGFLQYRQVQLDQALVDANLPYNPSLPLVRKLLDQGASPNARSVNLPPFSLHPLVLETWQDWLRRPERREGSPVLVDAAYLGHVDVVRELLARGADAHAVDRRGYSVLHYWSGGQRRNGKEIARLLLDHGAEVNDSTPEGRTALMYATDCQNSDAVSFLLSRGANPNARDQRGYTALRYGISTGKLDANGIRAMLAYGADVNTRASDGITPLKRARQAKASPAILRLLLQAGAQE